MGIKTKQKKTNCAQLCLAQASAAVPMAETGHPWRRHWWVPDTARNYSCCYLPLYPLPHIAPLGSFPAGWTPAGLPLETKADLTSLGQHCTGSNQFFHQRDTQQQVKAEEEKALKTDQPNLHNSETPFFFLHSTNWMENMSCYLTVWVHNSVRFHCLLFLSTTHGS